MEKVPRQFQTVPVCAEHAGFPRVNIWKPRVKYPAGSQPFQNLCEKLPWLVNVFEDVETSNNVETFGGDGSIDSVTYKDLGPRGCLGFRRRCCLHLDPAQFPGLTFHRSQESARAAANVQDCAALFMPRNQLSLSLPTAWS